jgi:hypothetical protein
MLTGPSFIDSSNVNQVATYVNTTDFRCFRLPGVLR